MGTQRRTPGDFASMVPSAHREYAQQVIGEAESAKAEFAKKRARAQAMETLDGDQGDELALHDAARKAAAAERERNRATAKAKRERAKGGSRRRRKADAWAERGRKLHARMQRHVASYEAKLRMLGQHDAKPVPVPPLVWGVTQQIMADASGHTARIKLASLPPDEARKIARAALRPEPYTPHRERQGRVLRLPTKRVLNGPAKWWSEPGVRRWCHPAAIRTVALGVGLWHMRQRSGRRGFSSVVRGIPRRMLCAIAADGLTGARPSLSSLFGNKDEVPGDVRALEQARCIRIQQAPGAKVAPCDRGPSGYAFNAYWWRRAKAAAGEQPEDEELDALREASSLRVEFGIERAPPEAA